MKRTAHKIAYSIAFNAAALFATINLLESVDYTGGWVFFIITGALIGILNHLVKPLLKFVSFPLIFFSAGLFLIIINAAILWITDQLLMILDFTNIDFIIEGPVNFVLAAIIFGITNWFAHWLLKQSR